jgi:hypothetical protein
VTGIGRERLLAAKLCFQELSGLQVFQAGLT